jgi:hypothetical protein
MNFAGTKDGGDLLQEDLALSNDDEEEEEEDYEDGTEPALDDEEEGGGHKGTKWVNNFKLIF